MSICLSFRYSLTKNFFEQKTVQKVLYSRENWKFHPLSIHAKMYFTKFKKLIKSKFLGLQRGVKRTIFVHYASKLLNQKIYFIKH